MKQTHEKNEMIALLLSVDECVGKWEYTSIYAGRSSVFALFLVFLKCMDDRSKSTEESLFSVLVSSVENADRSYRNEYLHGFYEKVLNHASCDSYVLELFIKRIDLEKAAKSFIKVMDVLLQVDFSSDKKVLHLIKAIQLLYGDVYAELDIGKKDRLKGLSVVTLAKVMLKPCEDCDIYGFSCGTGVLFSMIAESGSRIYVQEADLEKAIVAYILLRLRLEMNDLENLYFEVQLGDVLERPLTLDLTKGEFDRIVVEVPLGKRKVIADKWSISGHTEEFLFPDRPVDTGAWLYVRHAMKKLKIGGRAVVIAGISELSREGNSREDRENLLMYGAIDTVIQLPTHAGMTTKLCMIVLQKKTDKEAVYMVDLSNMDQLLAKKNNCDMMDDTDINYEKIIDMIVQKREKEGMSKYVSYGEIQSKGMNLTPAIYLRSWNTFFQEQGNLDELLSKEYRLCEQYEKLNREYIESVDNYYNLKM